MTHSASLAHTNIESSWIVGMSTTPRFVMLMVWAIRDLSQVIGMSIDSSSAVRAAAGPFCHLLVARVAVSLTVHNNHV